MQDTGDFYCICGSDFTTKRGLRNHKSKCPSNSAEPGMDVFDSEQLSDMETGAGVSADFEAQQELQAHDCK